MGLSRQRQPGSRRPSKALLGPYRLVLLLVFALLGVQWAAQGKHWVWLTGEAPSESDLPALTQLDFQAKRRPAKSSSADLTTPAIEPPANDKSANEGTSEQLPHAWLATMEDGSLGLSPSEQHGLDQAIQFVRSQPGSLPQAAAIRGVGFAKLNEHPEAFRGRRMEFEGTLWKLSVFQAERLNSQEIEGDIWPRPLTPSPSPGGRGGPDAGTAGLADHPLYEAWIYTPDAGNHPTRVLFTELPAALEPGERLDRPVRFSGYFIKRYGYETSRGTHLAPLFVARTLALSPEPVTVSSVSPRKSMPRRLIELILAGFASILLIWRFSRQRKNNLVPENQTDVYTRTVPELDDPPNIDHNRPA